MTETNTAYVILDRAERAIDGASRSIRKALGLTRPPRILPMKGYGMPDRVRVLARVLEDRGGHDPSIGRWRSAYRRWATQELPNVRVEIAWRDRRWVATTDEEGYVDLSVPAPERVQPGWHTVKLRVVSDGYANVTQAAEVAVVGPKHDYGVISDIDDTIIDTGVANLFSLVKSFVYELPAEKRPFPGVGELYRALFGGPGGSGTNPFFYVSSSPLNLYEHLETLFEKTGLPPGPLLLRDWGWTRQGPSPDGGHAHKLEKARAILEQTGDLRFVLVGDSGQRDPELYRDLVEAHRERILAVAIRDVTPDARDREVRELGEDIEAMGVPFVSAESSDELARFFASRGLIAEHAVREVAAEAA